MELQWTTSLSVGIAEIDAQHQELFRRAERLIVALRGGDRSEVGPLVSYLTDYVVEHFEAEEKEMRATFYPEYEAHKAAHDRFRADFAAMARDFERKGPTALVALTLHNWLSDWLRKHIGVVDLELGKFLVRRATR
jgi:hemerythrin